MIDEGSIKVGLGRHDELCRSKWIVGVNLIALVAMNQVNFACLDAT